jgi:hypothetical protein
MGHPLVLSADETTDVRVTRSRFDKDSGIFHFLINGEKHNVEK